MEVEATWPRVLKIWWAFLWRNLIAILVAMLLAGIVGGVIGAIMGTMGASPQTIQIVAAPIGGLIGLASSVVPVKLF